MLKDLEGKTWDERRQMFKAYESCLSNLPVTYEMVREEVDDIAYDTMQGGHDLALEAEEYLNSIDSVRDVVDLSYRVCQYLTNDDEFWSYFHDTIVAHISNVADDVKREKENKE